MAISPSIPQYIDIVYLLQMRSIVLMLYTDYVLHGISNTEQFKLQYSSVSYTFIGLSDAWQHKLNGI